MSSLKLILLLLSMLTIMAAGIIAPCLPELAKVFHSTPNADLLSKLVLSLPAIFIAISAPLAGRYIDKHGRLNLLFIALLLYAISGASGYVLNNIYHILIGRVFLGVAIGIIMTATITLIGDYFEGEERRRFIGYQSAFIGFSGIVFLSAGGLLADISWRLPFLIYLFPLVLIPICFRYLHEPGKSSRHSLGLPIASNGLVQLIFVTAIFFMILFYILPTQLPFFLQDRGFEKNSLSGTALAVNALGVVLSSLFYSKIRGLVDFPYVFTIGFMLMAVGFFFTSATAVFGIILVALFIAGLGFGLVLPNTNLWVMELTRPEWRGRNLGVLNTCFFLGQFLSPIAAEPLVRWFDLSFLFPFTAGLLAIISIGFLGLARFRVKIDASSSS